VRAKTTIDKRATRTLQDTAGRPRADILIYLVDVINLYYIFNTDIFSCIKIFFKNRTHIINTNN